MILLTTSMSLRIVLYRSVTSPCTDELEGNPHQLPSGHLWIPRWQVSSTLHYLRSFMSADCFHYTHFAAGIAWGEGLGEFNPSLPQLSPGQTGCKLMQKLAWTCIPFGHWLARICINLHPIWPGLFLGDVLALRNYDSGFALLHELPWCWLREKWGLFQGTVCIMYLRPFLTRQNSVVPMLSSVESKSTNTPGSDCFSKIYSWAKIDIIHIVRQ